MFDDVNLSNKKMWRQASKNISQELFKTLNTTPVGQTAKDIVARQVQYIKSLPIEAAGKVQDIHEMAFEIVAGGGRSTELVTELMRIENMTLGRANLIARTEVSRASTALTQARALSIGSEGYIWRSAGDSDVRSSHDDMDGKFVRWDSPPTLDGMTGHAGCLPYCRCYPEIVIPEI